MIVVTGGAGFIGANIVKGLNERGVRDVLVVDDLEKADKFKNLVDCEIRDYLDKRDFVDWLQQSGRRKLKAVFHEGACSDTMEHNGAYMMQNNFEYSKELLHYCQDRKVPFLYASSAAVYGAGKIFREAREHESPLNVYGYSKFLFDQYVRRLWPKRRAQIAGFRYFNVYGDREQHKGRMASVAFHQFNQFLEQGKVKLFEGCDGYGHGEQRRDFISVEDVVSVNFTFWTTQTRAASLMSAPAAASRSTMSPWRWSTACGRRRASPPCRSTPCASKDLIAYIPFPDALRGKYQSFTQADISALAQGRLQKSFPDGEEGVGRYVRQLLQRQDRSNL